MKNHKIIHLYFKRNNINFINNNHILLLSKYIDLLLDWNKKIRLTSSSSTRNIMKHILDSLQLLKLDFVSQCETILDIGTGAGFPGIILNIITNKKVSLIESNSKKCLFLKIIKSNLNLKNLSIYNERAEKLAHNIELREKFDIVVSRALSNFIAAMELCAPFSKIGGYIIYYLSDKIKDYIEKNFDKIKIFGLNDYSFFQYYILNNKYFLFNVKKICKTPDKYPRNYNKIKKNII
ncbi:MAG: 16S rRNA (guanine(527)-N(7))-methyltransferase RsmG [Candidatus Goldbacteria bacterium]|nr:16S rRNA (guanine(527)-N(7))-methyltransferase RsmG [Candidatus Goldiibacteriota bacterium]